MFNLTSKINDYITFNNKRIPINLSFDKVIETNKIITDEALTNEQKILKAFKLYDIQNKYTIAERAFLFSQILELIEDYTESIDNYNYSQYGEGIKSICYDKDTSLIYSAFMQCYNIDLFNIQGELHWVKFLMLLNNISEETKLSKIIGYRVTEIPTVNKHNQQEVELLLKMKSIYGLNINPQQAQNSINNALSGLFTLFGGRGGNNGQ